MAYFLKKIILFWKRRRKKKDGSDPDPIFGSLVYLTSIPNLKLVEIGKQIDKFWSFPDNSKLNYICLLLDSG